MLETTGNPTVPAGDEKDVTLEDGTVVTIRPIRPADKEALRTGILALSSRTRFLRFHGAVVDPSPAVLRYLTEVDGEHHVALVATMPSHDLKEMEGVGVARFVRDASDPTVAEAAVTVADAMQGKGVGTALLRELARRARGLGVRAFRAEVLDDNKPMLELLRSAHAAELSHDRESGTMCFEIAIDEPTRLDHALRLARSMGGALTGSLRRLLGLGS
jgi:GNAT superfamily N-acetyltransferase